MAGSLAVEDRDGSALSATRFRTRP
jgi:hypothetical protein